MHDGLKSYFVERAIISPIDIERIERLCADTGETFVSAVRRLGLLAGDKLAGLVSKHYSIPMLAHDDWPTEDCVNGALSPRYLREHHVLPIAIRKDVLIVAVADPAQTATIEAIRVALGRPIELRIAAAEDITAAIERRKVAGADIAPMVDTPAALVADDDVEQLKDLALGAPVVRIVNQLLLDALHARATDIHVEPFRGRLQIRMRVDGILRETSSPPPDLSRAIVSRLKIISGLNIAERRLPQDGRARVKIDARTVDLRVATMPNINGESVAIRLLENLQRVLDLSKLGFPDKDEAILRRRLAAPHGLVLVTGPTGSGKTTTLATAITILNERHRKILTVEDPIEYQIDGINQTQVKPEVGLGFANALRHFLRHDPDVIMVGEMRDAETAKVAVHAALTGHLVLSTLHTNSAGGAATRLLDMGVDGFLLASCLSCVIGQRLVRVLCPHCRAVVNAPIDLPDDILAEEELAPGQNVLHYEARGCDRCHGAGYAGRTVIIETLEVSDAIRRLMRRDVSTSEIAAAAHANGMITMARCGLRKCLAGITTPGEVRRVAIEA